MFCKVCRSAEEIGFVVEDEVEVPLQVVQGLLGLGAIAEEGLAILHSSEFGGVAVLPLTRLQEFVGLCVVAGFDLRYGRQIGTCPG